MKQDNQRNRRRQYYRQILQKKTVYSKTALDYERNRKGISPDEELYIKVMAPVLLEMVNWVLQDAVKAGIQRLYFLARDGYQMYLAASTLCREYKLPVECRYLKVSRYSLRVPEYHLIQEKCLERICVGGIDVTLEKIMNRAALSPEEGIRIARLMDCEKDYHRILNYQEVQQLKEKLKGQMEFLDFVYKHSKEAYPSTMGYLKQEGLLENIPYALVDSGWIGTLQLTLQNLLRTEKRDIKLKGYYFGLYELPAEADRNCYKAYYFTPKHGLKRKVHFSNCLFETVFSAPEGMTIGYEQKGNTYYPIINRGYNGNQKQQEMYAELLKGYLAMAKPLRLEEDTDTTMVEALLSACMGEPTELELEAYGENIFSDDVLENDMKRVAAKLSEEEIRNQRFLSKLGIMLGWKKDMIHESAWIEGSIVRNGKHTRQNLRHAALYKYFIYIRKCLKRNDCEKET